MVSRKKYDKPRVIISSDIGGCDPDDYQSMIHFLLYSDLVETEGIISSPPYAGRVSHILDVLHSYAEDYKKLRKWGEYPDPELLMNLSVQGALDVGAPGDSMGTDGSRRIIESALRDDPRPLYILMWGSMTDLAQAIKDCPEIIEKIRVYSIGSWNTEQDPESRSYIYRNHVDLWWIESDETFRGMYMGGNQDGDLGNLEFVEHHVKGHGALGDFFLSKKRDIKMGDTPSFLYIISPLVQKVGNWNDPTVESWGGAFINSGHSKTHWMDNPAGELSQDGKRGAKTVNKWRECWLRDWQKRMDRCV